MSVKTQTKKAGKTRLLNILFLVVAVAIILFLATAPEETTSFLPKDSTHRRFHQITSKKEAEKTCLQCHDANQEAPLSADHPPKFRCLFCHKRK